MLTIFAGSMTFKYIDRNYRDSVVIIPGWATDYRIFNCLDLDFNYFLPVDFSPFCFKKDLLAELRRNKMKKISLFGWSLGGFVAVEFAGRHPDIINELILVSIRKKYERGEIAAIRKYLKRNKKGYLYKFYKQCFSNREEMQWFRENLLEDYYKKFNLNYLLKTLEYLEKAEINPELLNGIERIKIIHGEHDRIAPMQEAIDIKSVLTHSKFICIKDAGHMPFSKENFNKFL